MATADSGLPSPPSGECIRLAWASLVIFSLLFLPALFIAYKHGKAGNMTWPLLVVSLISRIICEAYYLTRQNEPDIPTLATMITSNASTGTTSLLVIGLVYEALNLPLSPPRRWGSQATIIAVHIIFSIGTIMAAYGGNRDSKTPLVPKNATLSKTGNVIMFLVMLANTSWLWHATQHIFYLRQDINYHAANRLLMAAAPCTALQSIRLNYDVNYAFTNISSLNPVTGSFALRFISFSLQLAVVLMALTAGWFSRNAATVRLAALELTSTSNVGLAAEELYHVDSSRRALMTN